MNIFIERATENHVSGLVTLFKENYGSYHYPAFSHEKTLKNLLSHNLKGWVGQENKVIAFAGLYDIQKDNYHLIKLAHLLVDKEYQGHHIGSKLENQRKEYYSGFQHSLVIASCVDEPCQSVQLKLKHGFSCLGIKTHYRSSNLVGDNSIILGKYTGLLERCIQIEIPSFNTQTFIIQICNRNNFEYIFREPIKNIHKLKFEYEIDFLNNRIIGFVSQTNKGLLLDDLIKLFDSYNFRYISIKINTRITGFSQIDIFLCNNGYTPITYIPHYTKDVDLLEYQKLDDDSYKTYKILVEKYIRS